MLLKVQARAAIVLGRIKAQQQRQELADALWALKKNRAKPWKRSSPGMFASNLAL